MSRKHQSQRRAPKVGPHRVVLPGTMKPRTVGAVLRYGKGRWCGCVFPGELTPMGSYVKREIPGWFKSRRNAVAAVLREVAE